MWGLEDERHGDMSVIRGTALIFLLFAVLSSFMAYRAQDAVTDSHDLREASGRVVFARSDFNISGSRYKVTSRKRRFRIDGVPYIFIYSSGLPKFDQVVDAVTQGRMVTVLYGNCHGAAKKPRCEVMQVSQAGVEVVTLREVLDHLSDDFVLWTVLAVVCVLASLSIFWACVRAQAAAANPGASRR